MKSVSELFAVIDTDNSDSISFTELTTWWGTRCRQQKAATVWLHSKGPPGVAAADSLHLMGAAQGTPPHTQPATHAPYHIYHGYP
eukprot:COSAG05_NODE_204_length_14187_cov_99.887422_4_plen_85_part_00